MAKVNIKIIPGVLEVTPKKKGGFVAVFRYSDTNPPMPLSAYLPKDASFHEKPGKLTTEDGKPVRLIMDSGDVLIGTKDQTELPDQTPDSFLPHATALARSTRSALAGFKDVDNFSLKFYKTARLEREEGKLKFQFYKADRGKVVYQMKADFGHISFAAVANRTVRGANALGYRKTDGNLVRLDVKSDWRWVAGLGTESVYENGMTLHHVYGIPYLPGSGVKGMLRTWIINQCWGHTKDAEEMALLNPVFRRLFGYANQSDADGEKGGAIFFDAFPVSAVKVEPDVMNNHYQDYYEDRTPPGDWLNPLPIFFMTVKESTIRFLIGVSKGNEPVGEQAKELLHKELPSLTRETTLTNLVQAWLQHALQHHGIGAKTAVGYGRMLVSANG